MGYQQTRKKTTHPGIRLLQVVVAGVVLCVGWSAFEAYQELQEKEAEIARAEAEAQRLSAEVSDLKQWIEDMKNNVEVQKTVVREFYPAVSGNETLYAIPVKSARSAR